MAGALDLVEGRPFVRPSHPGRQTFATKDLLYCHRGEEDRDSSAVWDADESSAFADDLALATPDDFEDHTTFVASESSDDP